MSEGAGLGAPVPEPQVYLWWLLARSDELWFEFWGMGPLPGVPSTCGMLGQ